MEVPTETLVIPLGIWNDGGAGSSQELIRKLSIFLRLLQVYVNEGVENLLGLCLCHALMTLYQRTYFIWKGNNNNNSQKD